jgi:hypothetical protein
VYDQLNSTKFTVRFFRCVSGLDVGTGRRVASSVL